MQSLYEQLEDATHSDWSGGAPAVELRFAQELVEEVLRLRSLARYQPLICGHLVDDVLGYLGMALAPDAFESIKDRVERFKTHAYAQDIPQAWLDVIDERRRQFEKLGFTHQQDDGYIYAELPRAALCYLLKSMGKLSMDEGPPNGWPWSDKFWKPRSPREDLVRAVALLIAEIERLDRQPEQAR